VDDETELDELETWDGRHGELDNPALDDPLA
jgi:hypothetical protein